MRPVSEAPAPPPHRRRAPTIFGLVPDGTARRRPSDVVAVVTVAIVVLVAAWLARHPGELGRWTFELVTDLPEGLRDAFRAVYLVGCVSVIVALVGAFVLRRHIRLAVSMVGAGLLAWLIGLGVLALLDPGPARSTAGLGAFGTPPGFPAIRLAAAVAVLFVAGPYLTRPARRLVHLVLLVCGVSAVLAVEGLLTDVLGSVALGWGVAALVHLVIGSPAGTPSNEQVTDALRDLGLEPSDLRWLPGPWRWSRFRATLGDGANGFAAQVAVIGRDARDSRFFGQLWRSVWYKRTGTDLIWDRRHQVEHWAYLLLTAEKAGVRVPGVMAAGSAGRRDDALLVTRPRAGTALAELDPADVTDAVLDDAWLQLSLLRHARIAKGGVRTDAVTVTPDGRTELQDFSQASYPAPAARIANDAVDLLVGSAELVGVDRAAAAAHRGLGPDGLAELLPLIQPGALSRDARRQLSPDKKMLAELRTASAAAAGTQEPKLAELRRVSVSDLLMTVGTIVGVYLLIGQFAGLSGVGNTFRTASWAWVAAAFAISQLPQIASAFAMIGSVIAPLALGPVIGVQYANNFTGLVGGSVADVALVIRFLQRQGQPAGVAVSSGLLNNLAGSVVQFVLIPVSLVLSGSTFDFSGGEASGIFKLVVLAIVVVGGVAGILLFVPNLRHRLGDLVRPQWDSARDNVAQVLTRPRKAFQLFGAKLASQVLFAMVLWCSVRAYGGHLSLVQLIFVNSVASLIGGAAPVPGGMGVIEAGLIAGLTAAGLSKEVAVAATFTHRLFTAYLPPVWGWFALEWLKRREYI